MGFHRFPAGIAGNRYWFADYPWNDPEAYLSRSPLHFVDQASTPTMLLTGERDLRTPISESEQFYQALKLLKVDTALVRVPEASHGIAARPSHLIGKVQHILAWFARYDSGAFEEDEEEEPVVTPVRLIQSEDSAQGGGGGAYVDDFHASGETIFLPAAP